MSFLLAARQGRTGFSPYAAGLACVVILYVVLSIAAATIIFGVAGLFGAEGVDAADFETIPTLPLGAFGPAATLAVLLLPAVAVPIVVILITRLLHRRDVATLVRADGRPRWRRAALAAAVWTGAAAVFEGVGYLLYPESYSWTFDAARFLPLLVVCLLLVPLHAAADSGGGSGHHGGAAHSSE